MKIAYVANIYEFNCGPLKKMQGQMKAWLALGHEVRPFFIRQAHSDGSEFSQWKRLNMLNPQLALLRALKEYKPDLVYLREQPMGLFLLLLLFLFRKKMVVEINSRMRTEQAGNVQKSLRSKGRYNLSVWAQPHIMKKVLGIVAVTEELARFPEFYNKNNAVIPNGIWLDDFSVLKKPDGLSFPIRLVFMGSPDQAWSGVDKMLKMLELLGTGFELHLIGPDMRQAFAARQENVFWHGYLRQKEYSEIFKDMHIALGTFAWHRSQINEACPLKVREYLAAGFPVINAYRDTAFMNFKHECLLEIPNKENLFEAPGLLNEVRSFCVRNRNTVANLEDFRSRIDMFELEKSKMNQIGGWLK